MGRGLDALAAMEFPQRLAALRKEKGLTQQALADQVGVHVSQLRRYEAGQSQPTLEVVRKLAVALSVSADLLVFDRDERGPDDELKLQFEAVGRLEPFERTLVREVLDSILVRHDARRLFTAAGAADEASP
jgi:transcriptional regulator with XRE-family HTH domain